VDAADEAELLAKAQGGDQDAFMTLVERELPRLKILCRNILKNESDVEDALQTAQLKAWENRWGCQSFPSWFYRITRNTALDVYRNAYRRRQAPLDDPLPEDHANFEDKRIWGHDLMEMATKLSPEERMLLELHHFRGYQLDEAAEIMGKSYPAIRQQWSRMMEKMRKILRPDYFPTDGQQKGRDESTA
jgi:RNA polymerase sigma-70 factor, ECF subfamily